MDDTSYLCMNLILEELYPNLCNMFNYIIFVQRGDAGVKLKVVCYHESRLSY